MLDFPHVLMREAVTDRPRLVGSARSGGRSVSGVVSMTRTDGGGLWAYGLQSIAITTREHVMAFEMIATLMAEGARPINVPVCNRRYMPPPVNGVVGVFAAADAALRATTLVLDLLVMAGPFVGGELFSIAHPTMGNRLYRIVGITAQDSFSATITIEPPLRQAIVDNTPLNFNEPVCAMQLAEPVSLQLDMRRFGRPSINFIETFLPLD